MATNDKPSQEQLDNWRADPTNMKLGLFYYNKEDKRIFPPKKYGIGWTVNFANPLSIIAVVLLIVVIVLVSTIVKKQ